MRLTPAALVALAACAASTSVTGAEHTALGVDHAASAAEHAAAEQARPAGPPAVQPTAFSVEVHGHGPPVILIPGLGCPGSVWSGTVEHLHGYRTYNLTLAGFAGKPRIDGPLVKTTVEQLADYIRDHHLVRPVIIGHSLGGFVAYWLAAREPELVGPVVIVDAGSEGGSGDRETVAAAAAQARDRWREISDEQFAQQVKDVFGQMSVRPARLQPVLVAVARSDRRAIGDAVYELSVTTSVSGQLERIRTPVLLVLADGALQNDFRRQARAVRDHQVVVVPNTGHFVMIDDPAGFYAAVDDFLDKHAALASRSAR